MLSVEESRQALAELFSLKRIADLQVLFKVLRTTSRMSVFRRLSGLGYLTSYSHTGRYYTLEGVPDFDADGLWQHQGVLFSRHGLLKPTVEHLVCVSEAGRTHEELQLRLHVRVHNALLFLVKRQRIARETLGALYLYVSGDSQTATRQVAARRKQQEPVPMPLLPPVSTAVVIEVLLEIIHSSRSIPEPKMVAAALNTRSVPVTLHQVETIFTTYGLKKTAGSRSRHSRP